MTSGIVRLADHVGILGSYVDQFGKTRETTEDTRLALLRGMGYGVRSDADAAAVLESMLDEERRQVIDPVAIQQADAPAAIHARVPRRKGAVRWQVEIRSERGRVAKREGVHDQPGPLEIDTPPLGMGYYDVRLRITTSHGEQSADQTLIVVPSRCHLPSDVLGERGAFGVFANLYSVRSARNWGVGDFGDLDELTQWVASIGGSFVGLNPLHALLNRGGDISPYGPVTRLWRNPIYIDVERVPEFRESESVAERIRSAEISSALSALREGNRVQYDQVWATKSLALAALHEAFIRRRAVSPRDDRVLAFNEFVERGGRSLDTYARWMAIAADQHNWNWREWPRELQDSNGGAVRRYGAEHSKQVDLHRWMQFELDRQLGEIAERAGRAGMEIGLYQDLAVGSSGTGSDTWAYPDLFHTGPTIGAPPDPYSDFGQNWGLPPLDPRALKKDRYRYFVRLVRSAFRHAGALRIDHVMGLFRLFWIPEGGSGRDGAYVRYPAEDLLGILALESRRHQAIVVGEDLGVVPPEVGPAMERWGLLSSKVLYFEREDGGRFKPSSSYKTLSLASANTHDLPTVAGFWSGLDIELRQRMGLIDGANATDGVSQRRNEKEALVHRLHADGALPIHEHPSMGPEGVPAIRRAVNNFLCGTPAALVALSLDDLGDETTPVNVPGVGPDRYPCWGRRMHRTIPEIAAMSTEELTGCQTRARPG